MPEKITGVPKEAFVAAALALIVVTALKVLLLVTTLFAAAPVKLSVIKVPAEFIPTIVQVTVAFEVEALYWVIFVGIVKPQLVEYPTLVVPVMVVDV